MAILPTHKYGIEYLEHCAIRAADDRLVYVRRRDAVELHFSIPNLNTAVLLLGPGTSLTQQAARLCAEGNVLLAFCAGGGTPIYFASLSEYREPRYSRDWIRLWHDESHRLKSAKQFQYIRARLVATHWKKLEDVEIDVAPLTDNYAHSVELARDVNEILAIEAEFTKKLYAELAKALGGSFSRKPRSTDLTNHYLDSGNYLAYGLAACALWVMVIPFSYPLVHGKTRRGALVFDVADLVKDALVMPAAFIAAAKGEPENLARRRQLAALHDAKALKVMFAAILEQIEPAPAHAN